MQGRSLWIAVDSFCCLTGLPHASPSVLALQLYCTIDCHVLLVNYRDADRQLSLHPRRRSYAVCGVSRQVCLPKTPDLHYDLSRRTPILATMIAIRELVDPRTHDGCSPEAPPLKCRLVLNASMTGA